MLLTARRPAINDVPDPSKPSISSPFGPKICEITPVNAPTNAPISEPSSPCQCCNVYVMVWLYVQILTPLRDASKPAKPPPPPPPSGAGISWNSLLSSSLSRFAAFFGSSEFLTPFGAISFSRRSMFYLVRNDLRFFDSGNSCWGFGKGGGRWIKLWFSWIVFVI